MALSDFRDAWITAASDFRGRMATRDHITGLRVKIKLRFLSFNFQSLFCHIRFLHFDRLRSCIFIQFY